MKTTLAAAAALALGAGAAVAQDTTTADQQGSRRYKIVGQVVSSDPSAHTITLRSVSRRQDGTRRYETVRRDTATTSDRDREASEAMAAGEAVTLTATGQAIGEVDDYKAGDWVELTCADAATANRVRTSAGTPSAGAAGAANTTAAAAGTSGAAESGDPQERFAGWVRTNCGVVTDIDGSRDPMGTSDRR